MILHGRNQHIQSRFGSTSRFPSILSRFYGRIIACCMRYCQNSQRRIRYRGTKLILNGILSLVKPP